MTCLVKAARNASPSRQHSLAGSQPRRLQPDFPAGFSNPQSYTTSSAAYMQPPSQSAYLHAPIQSQLPDPVVIPPYNPPPSGPRPSNPFATPLSQVLDPSYGRGSNHRGVNPTQYSLPSRSVSYTPGTIAYTGDSNFRPQLPSNQGTMASMSRVANPYPPNQPASSSGRQGNQPPTQSRSNSGMRRQSSQEWHYYTGGEGYTG